MSGNSSKSKPETNQHLSSINRGFLTTVRISVTIVVILSLLNIAGWIFDISIFKSLIPKSEPMKLITALCFVFACAALVVILEDFPAIIKKTIPAFFATVICFESLCSVFAYLYLLGTGHELSVAEIFSLSFFLAPDKRMALLTACNLLLIGCMLFLLSSGKKKASELAHLLIIPVFLISYLNIVKYLLDVSSLNSLSYVSIPLNTGIGFCVISAGFLFTKPDTWFLQLFTSSTTGIISRRLLPPLIVLPIIIGWLRIQGERFGLVESEAGVVMTTIIYSVCFLILVWLTTRYVNRVDRERQASEEALKKSYRRLEILSDTASRLLITDDPQKLINELCIRVMNYLECQVFFNFLIDGSTGKLQLNTYSGITAESAQKIEWIDYETTICGKAFLDIKRIIAENIQEIPDPIADHIKSLGIKAYACHPLLSPDLVIGTISFGTNNRTEFSDEDLSMMKIVADYIAISLTRAKYEKTLRENEIRLKELNDTKDKFFNIVAHDLKNPFTSMLGSSELLYNNIHKMTSENIRELALILNDSAKSGYAILQNLLDWSRSQTGLLKFNPEKINLKELFDKNISNLELPASNKKINLYSELGKDIYLTADKNMINTVLRNLLSNAVKFTPRCGTVVIDANNTSEEVIISVKDTGIGIPDDKIEKLFRIDSRNSMPGTENEPGTGLGLKLSKEFVEKMGGNIWVRSVENKGSEFSFSIPIKEG